MFCVSYDRVAFQTVRQRVELLKTEVHRCYRCENELRHARVRARQPVSSGLGDSKLCFISLFKAPDNYSSLFTVGAPLEVGVVSNLS